MATPNNEKPIIVAFTLDFETGGLDCQDCACTQIAIHAVRIDTFETIDRYVKYISPYNKQPDKGVAKRKVLKSKFDKDDEQPMKYEEKAKCALKEAKELEQNAKCLSQKSYYQKVAT